MILRELKKKPFLKYAKGYCFSESYAIFCTGKSAFICDKAFNLLHTIEGLSYVYHAFVSPNEKILLLISNKNIFYLVYLNDFSVKKYTIRGEYNTNLEGRGCWSFDGKSLYFNIFSRKTLNSALRRYTLSNDMSYEDMLIEKYWLVNIKPIKELNKYLLIGLDRKKTQIGCWHIIWFDGVLFEECPIYNENVDNDCISFAEYEAVTNTIILYGHDKTYRSDLSGRIIEDMSLSTPQKITGSFSEAISNLGFKSDVFENLKSLSSSLGIENVSLDDSVYKVCLSFDAKKYYIGTHLGIIVIDAETKETLGSRNIEYGVQSITEISPNIIVVSTYCGIKIYEVID